MSLPKSVRHITNLCLFPASLTLASGVFTSSTARADLITCQGLQSTTQVFAVSSAHSATLTEGVIETNLAGAIVSKRVIEPASSRTPMDIPEPSPLLLSSVFGMMIWGGRLLRRIRGGK